MLKAICESMTQEHLKNKRNFVLISVFIHPKNRIMCPYKFWIKTSGVKNLAQPIELKDRAQTLSLQRGRTMRGMLGAGLKGDRTP